MRLRGHPGCVSLGYPPYSWDAPILSSKPPLLFPDRSITIPSISSHRTLTSGRRQHDAVLGVSMVLPTEEHNYFNTVMPCMSHFPNPFHQVVFHPPLSFGTSKEVLYIRNLVLSRNYAYWAAPYIAPAGIREAVLVWGRCNQTNVRNLGIT